MLMVDSYLSLLTEFRRLTAPGTQENGWSNKLHLLLFYQELLFCLQGTRAEVASIALASPSVWGKRSSVPVGLATLAQLVAVDFAAPFALGAVGADAFRYAV
jgi:hypothetical protein